MRTTTLLAVLAVITVTRAAAADEPKPKPVDISAIRDQVIVAQDIRGGTYVALNTTEPRVFYGTGTTLYEQLVSGRSANGDEWSITTWAPRLPDFHPAYFEHQADGTFKRICDGLDDMVLTQVTGDKAKRLLAKLSFATTATLHRPQLLARDDSGIYYYVDRLGKEYGGAGFRVFVGKKGAMVQVPLDEVANDSAGSVYSTKRGDLRLIGNDPEGKQTVTWVRGGKHTALISLDIDANSQLIFRDLGIYTFIGTMCENI